MTRDPGHNPEKRRGAGEGHAERLVVIDTDPGVRWSLEKGLTRSGYNVVAANTVGQVLKIAHEERVDGIVMELLPEAGLTLEVLSSLVAAPQSPRLVCISVDSAPQTVIECMRRGAADFLTKPFSLAEVRGAVRRAMARESKDKMLYPSRPLTSDAAEPSHIVGVSAAVRDLRTIVQQVAQTDLNCLVRGESGVGKDMVAREVHRLSRRNNEPFVKVNCSALPEQLLESELFGYKKGAFTGAVTSKPGRFHLANNGIIFLDEIADMHPNLQAKILQVIEHKEFTRLGGAANTKVDVQIIAATNADLEKRTALGAFRNDLYFRLNEVCIWVPSLRERKEDVPLLVHHFIQKHAHYACDKSVEIAGKDLAAMSEYDWPGNVRELESTVKRWLVLGEDVLKPYHAKGSAYLPGRLGPASGTGPLPGVQASVPKKEPEPEEIVAALERHQWNRRKAAQTLGMSYQALRRRIEKYGIDKRE